MQALAKELIAYLAVTDAAFRPSLADHLCRLVQRFAPTTRWFVDSLLNIFVIAGPHVDVRSLPFRWPGHPCWCRLRVPL